MKRIILTLASVITALAVSACGQNNEASQAGETFKDEEPAGATSSQTSYVTGEGVHTVEVISAEVGMIPQESYYSASIQAYAVNNIAPQNASRIQKLLAEVGDFVSSGQKVAEMDHVQLDQAELKLKNTEIELERCRQLFNEGGMAQSDFESMELSYNVALSTYNNLLENTDLRSPISGVISARNYDRGDMYTMGQPIYTVQQITPVKLLVGVSESDYTRVTRGDKISLTVDAIPGTTFTGKIIRLYPVMDESSHTFNVEVQVRNEDRKLRPGMYAKVCVNFGESENIIIPDNAVLKQQGAGQRYVFVMTDEGLAESMPVTLGRHFDGKYEIISGLNTGDKVVVRGQNILKSGDKLQVASE